MDSRTFTSVPSQIKSEIEYLKSIDSSLDTIKTIAICFTILMIIGIIFGVLSAAGFLRWYSDSQMEINQTVLLHALMKLLVLVKVDRSEILRLSTEVAALRNTLQELSGDRFLPVVERHRKKLQNTTASIEAAELQEIDALIPLYIVALPEGEPPQPS
jgi:hypothetical protein